MDISYFLLKILWAISSKTHKIYFQKIFFQAILVASIYDLKIDFIMFDPPHVKLIVFVNPVYSQVCEHRL